LNLGCGVGAYSFLLEQEFSDARIVSLDISNNCLNIGRQHYNISLPVRADALYVPFKAASFDIVILSEVIEHIVEQSQLVNEVSRVIKGGGYLVLTTSPLKSDIFYSAVQKMKKKKFFGLHEEKEHVAVQHPSDIRRRLEERNFNILEEGYWNLLHLRSIQSLLSIPLIGTLIELADDRLGFLSRLCTDFICVAKKERSRTCGGG
jgi:ubiquinone/menaquinone biosynthesis C-methylase UbiE